MVAAIYDCLQPIKSSVFTINQGGEILNAKLKRELNTLLIKNYQDYEMPYLNIDDNKIKPITEKLFKDQLDLILSECKKYNWNVTEIPIIFTGGGSLVLSKQIKNIPNARISVNPIWDNVEGYLILRELYFNE